MNYIEGLRNLAKSNEYQNVYILAKEIGSIKIFENIKDFTYIQNLFLRYLNFYYNLYNDISIGEVDEIVLENSIYSDSYMMWKNKYEKDKYKNLTNEKTGITQKEQEPLNTSTWIFKSAKNKVK